MRDGTGHEGLRSKGRRTVSRVPDPGTESTARVPSTAPARCRSPVSPVPSVGSAPPQPSSVTDDDEGVTLEGYRHRCVLRAGMFRDVGQCLGDTEVGDGLDGRRRPAHHVDPHRHRNRRARRQRGQRGVQPSVGQHRRVDPPGHLADLDDGVLRRLMGPLDQLARPVRVDVQLGPGHAQVHRDGDQSLLGAVVEVALDASPLEPRPSRPSPRATRSGSGPGPRAARPRPEVGPQQPARQQHVDQHHEPGHQRQHQQHHEPEDRQAQCAVTRRSHGMSSTPSGSHGW